MRSSPGTSHVRGPLPDDDVLRARVKAALRKSLRGLRATTPLAACSERSARIVERLEAHEALASARTAALFWPIVEKHEVDLRPLDARLRARGVRVAYPTVDDAGAMAFLFVDDPAMMVDHALGFRAPRAGSGPARELDVIVVPAIALDPTGQRVGYGGGFYDRALPSHPRATTLGVAYDFQLVPEVAATRYDVPVQWVVTDGRVLRASPAAALTARVTPELVP